MNTMGMRLSARRDAAAGAALLAAAAGIGAVSALAAFAVHPLAAPAGLTLAATAGITVLRMEVGVAVAFVLLPLGYVVESDIPPWLPGTAWVGLLFAISLARWLPAGRHDRRSGGLETALLAVLLVAGVGVLVAGGSAEALPPLRALVTGLALAFVIATGIRSQEQVRWVLGGLSAATVVVGAYAALEYLGGRQTDAGFFTSSGELARRVSAGFGQPNQLGGLLVLLIPFSIAGVILHRRAAPLHVAAIALGTYGVYVSFSRGALIGLLLIPLVFARGRTVLLVFPLLVAAVALATPDLVQERFATLTEQGSDFATRLDFWKVAVSVWADAPLLGGGLGSFPEAYAQARVPGKEFLPTSLFEPPPHAHNLALQMLAEQGVLGLTALLAVIAAVTRAAVGLRASGQAVAWALGSAALAALVALLAHNLVDVTLFEATAAIFWASLGLLIAARHGLESERPA